jgi:transcription initiation factor IIF auxiliary subunit
VSSQGAILYSGLQGVQPAWTWTVNLAGSVQALDSVAQVVWHVPLAGGRLGDFTRRNRYDAFALTGNHLGTEGFTLTGTVTFKDGTSKNLSRAYGFAAPRRSLELVQTDRYLGFDPAAGQPFWEWTLKVQGNLMELADVRSVTYHLHPSFPNPDREVATSPQNGFAFTTSGWGTFPVRATVRYADDSTQSLETRLVFRSPRKDELGLNNTAQYVGAGPDGAPWYDWTVYVEGPLRDLRNIRSVRYLLHPTFQPNAIDVAFGGPNLDFPYTTRGWGTFVIRAQVLMADGQVRELSHPLRFKAQ